MSATNDNIASVRPNRATFVTIKGVKKLLATMEELNERYALLEVPGSASVYVSRRDFLLITDGDLKRRLAGEVVLAGMDGERSIYESAFAFWTGHSERHVYRRVAFTSEQIPDDTYNLYRGLGVTPRAGQCKRILAHVKEVICDGNNADADAMLKLLAWQLQNIGKPSRVIVILISEKHQAGKGVFSSDLMSKIYGPSGFTASTMDQVLGRFNDPLRGCANVVLDEVLFGGDRRAADKLKSLSTATIMGIETKGLPIVQCPIALNFWINTNHANAAYVEKYDARYWVLNVSEHRVGDAEYFADLMKEIEQGGREAFAHYLLKLDVSNFVPSRDVPRDNAAKREMIKQSINPFDARKWLEECISREQIIGRKSESGPDWIPWIEGDKRPFYELANAYTVWQGTVRTRIAPEPTKSNELGKVLSDAGFGDHRSKQGMSRVVPNLNAALAKLRASAFAGGKTSSSRLAPRNRTKNALLCEG